MLIKRFDVESMLNWRCFNVVCLQGCLFCFCERYFSHTAIKANEFRYFRALSMLSGKAARTLQSDSNHLNCIMTAPVGSMVGAILMDLTCILPYGIMMYSNYSTAGCKNRQKNIYVQIYIDIGRKITLSSDPRFLFTAVLRQTENWNHKLQISVQGYIYTHIHITVPGDLWPLIFYLTLCSSELQAPDHRKTLYEPAHDKTTVRRVWPAKTQISVRICAGWSECSLIACTFYSLQAIKRGMNENPFDTRWTYMLIWIFAGHTGLIVGFVVR